jgi:DNA-binding transcriptional regulator LsrR (DeoR family)
LTPRKSAASSRSASAAASSRSTPQPTFAEKRTRDALLKLPQVRSVHDHLGRAQVAIVGLGTLENSVFVERGALGPEAVAELREAGAVGEICGRFFDRSGAECDTLWRDQVMSVEAEQLRKIPQVIGVVSGNDRSEAIAAAIRGKLLKGLVIDETGAAALLAATTPRLPAQGKSPRRSSLLASHTDGRNVRTVNIRQNQWSHSCHQGRISPILHLPSRT